MTSDLTPLGLPVSILNLSFSTLTCEPHSLAQASKQPKRAEVPKSNAKSDLVSRVLRLKWPFTEWENGPGAKIPEKWERKWKMAPRPKWPKNGRRNGKMDPKMGFWPDFDPFSISAAIFRPFQAWGHFPFSFPFFRDFCSGPVSHSVNGHFDRNSSPKLSGSHCSTRIVSDLAASHAIASQARLQRKSES